MTTPLSHLSNFILSKILFSALTLGLLLPSLTEAQTVVLKISPKVSAIAQYHTGNKKTAILLAHGFMTTNQHPTIQALQSALLDEDYTVLSPNLTLGISDRHQSLKCNSIHTHTLDDDVHEITLWIHWLQQQGYQKIILLGHSSGSQELLLSQIKAPNPAVKLAIFTSLFYFNGPELGTLPKDIAFAKQHLHDPLPPLHKYSFLFCKNNFLATPKSYLSYQTLTRQFNLSLLKKLTIPSITFMGGADKRYQQVGRNWLEALKQAGTQVIMIPKANHFFSNEGEFEVQDKLINIIKQSGL